MPAAATRSATPDDEELRRLRRGLAMQVLRLVLIAMTVFVLLWILGV